MKVKIEMTKYKLKTYRKNLFVQFTKKSYG